MRWATGGNFMSTAIDENSISDVATASDRQQPTEIPAAHCNVLIVGGGPAGLAAALMLAQRGWTEITVLERRMAANDYEPDKSFNYLIDARGQQFTDLLGLTEPLARIAVPAAEFQITRIQPNGDRKTLTQSFNDPKPGYWLFRSEFLQLLYQEIEHNWKSQITVLFNSCCTAINKAIKNNTETLEVVVEHEDFAIPQRLKPTLLIGCDGIQSIVRSTLNTWDPSGKFELQQFPSPSSGLRYKALSLPPNFPLDPAGETRAVSTHSYSVRGKFRERRRAMSLGLLPLRDQDRPRPAMLVNWADHQLWQLKTGEEVLNFLAQSFPQLPLCQMISLPEADRFAKSTGGTFPIPQFCSGLHYLLPSPTKCNETTASSVLLLGDAAHCFPPDMGQGVNSALEDVYILNQVLAENEDDLVRSLPSYETRRSPDVEALVRLAQIAAPWQYNQAPLRTKLWLMGVVVRLGLSKILPFISPPIAFQIRDPQYSYREIWLNEQRTSRILYVMIWMSFGGLLVCFT
jgi:kynurenine 3-monooxygenase